METRVFGLWAPFTLYCGCTFCRKSNNWSAAIGELPELLCVYTSLGGRFLPHDMTRQPEPTIVQQCCFLSSLIVGAAGIALAETPVLPQHTTARVCYISSSRSPPPSVSSRDTPSLRTCSITPSTSPRFSVKGWETSARERS